MISLELTAKIKRKVIDGKTVNLPGLGRFYLLDNKFIVFENEKFLYDPTLSYENNFKRSLPYFKYTTTYKNTKLGAGVAINSNYIKMFGELGYEYITYKTVRSHFYAGYPFPNILGKINGKWYHPDKINWNSDFIEAITNSYGMPSQSPEFWIKDVDIAKELIKNNQKLVLSWVGDTLEDIIKTGELVSETPADILEFDASCPNYGPLIYLNPKLCKKIITKIKTEKPIIIKVGSWKDYNNVKEFCNKVGHLVYGIEAINGVKENGFEKFLGKNRDVSGTCGPNIFPVALRNVKWLNKAREELGLDFKIFGIGGIYNTETAKEMFESGVDVVGSVTAAMLDPDLPHKITNCKEI